MQSENPHDIPDKIIESVGDDLIDLNTSGVCTALSKRISHEIDEHCSEIYDDGFRWHLGASKMGEECKRALWYSFRWVDRKKHDGRQQRLFNRGHTEEKRHREWLEGIGFKVWFQDESKVKEDGTHPQLRMTNKCGGHLGGSLDGILEFPERYKIKGYAILESKTNGTGAGFNSLAEKGVAKAKPVHYIQNSMYGASYDINHVLYLCANKNDDSLYVEVAKLDFNLAKQMEAKAHSIIFSQEPPAKISENPTFLACKSFCDYKDVCHNNKQALKNCRSCVSASAVDGAQFYCATWDGIIPREEVYKGCPKWQPITVIAIKPKADSGFLIEDVPIPK